MLSIFNMVFDVHWYLGSWDFWRIAMLGLCRSESRPMLRSCRGGARKKAKNICRIFWKQTSSSFILFIILRLHFIFHSRHLVGIFAILAALHNLPHWLTHWSGVRKIGYMEVRGALRNFFGFSWDFVPTGSTPPHSGLNQGVRPSN